jgi:hypothetical protein
LKAVPEIYSQLEEISVLNDAECYIYMMFPFCDVFDKIPDEILNLRSKEPQIPKIIHYIWLGGKQIPEKNQKWMETWKKQCPDYEIRRWDESNYNVEKCRYSSEAYKKGKYSFVSDYIRLDVVYQYGGIYLDTDVELLKPLDDLLYFKAFGGMGTSSGIASGLGFGSVRGNSLIREMRDVYNDVDFIKKDDNLNLQVCDYYQTEVLKRYGFFGGNKFHNIRDFIVFPVCFFSPMSSLFGILNLNRNAYSIHHFDTSYFSNADLETKKQSQKMFMDIFHEENDL